MRVLRLQAVDVEPAFNGGDACLHPAVAMAQPILAANLGRFGVEPSQGGCEFGARRQGARRCDPIAPRDIELAIEHHAGRLPSLHAIHPLTSPLELNDLRVFTARKNLHRIAYADLALRHPAPQASGLVAGAVCDERGGVRLRLTSHILHGQHEGAVVRLCHRGQLLQQFEQGRAAVPTLLDPAGDVVATQCRNRNHASHGDSRSLGKAEQSLAHGVKRRSRIADRIELVHRKDDARHPQQLRQQGMAAGLRQQRHRAACGVEFGDVHQHHSGVAARCSRDHIARVLLVAGGVGDDELARRRGEVAVRHVDGDALLALGFQPVGQQGKIKPRAGISGRSARAAGQGIELIGQDGAAVIQQAPDQGALAVIHTACGQKTQGAGVVLKTCGAHQK